MDVSQTPVKRTSNSKTKGDENPQWQQKDEFVLNAHFLFFSFFLFSAPLFLVASKRSIR